LTFLQLSGIILLVILVKVIMLSVIQINVVTLLLGLAVTNTSNTVNL